VFLKIGVEWSLKCSSLLKVEVKRCFLTLEVELSVLRVVLGTERRLQY